MTLPSLPVSTDVFARLPPASWRRLGDTGLIRAKGPEARAFLQSQLSNDATLITETQAQLSGYCSAKGRLLAVLTVSQLGADEFALELPKELLAPTLKRLRMFVLRSKLVLDDASDEQPTLAVAGRDAAETLRALQLPAPIEPLQTAVADGVQVIRRAGAWPRWTLRAAPERLAVIGQSLASVPMMPAEHGALADLLAGLPVVRAETLEHFVPQTVDLDLAGGISFSKGCYPGQEIVARVHYLGRLKQRLFLASSQQPAIPGTSVYAPGESQAVGEVVDYVAGPAGAHYLALMLGLQQADKDGLRLGSADGPPMSAPRPAHPTSKD